MQRQPVSQSPHFQHPDNIINENRQNIRHHIKPKTTFINSNNNSINSNNNNNPDTTTMNIISNNNNNNNSSINNNNTSINLTNNNHHKFGVQQVNSSSKMLDNQKYQKYFAKRKLLAQYEQEMRQEKRNRTGGSIDDDDNDSNRPLNMRRSQSDVTEDDSRNTDIGSAKSISVGLNLIQNIKTEKGDDDHADINGNDDGNETGTGFYGSHLSKMKHSILEPNIVLQHSDEVISASNGSNSITSTLQNTNLSQKTAS